MKNKRFTFKRWHKSVVSVVLSAALLVGSIAPGLNAYALKSTKKPKENNSLALYKGAIMPFAAGGLLPADDLFQEPVSGEIKDRLQRQIVWADFNNAVNLGPNDTLQVGTVLTIDVMKGYRVICTVTKLGPFNSSIEYKKHIDEDPNATPEAIASYDPNAPNWNHEKNKPAFMKAEPQSSTYSNMARSGMSVLGKSTLATSDNGDEIGVEFLVTAEYWGTPVKPTVIVTDGEEQADNGREWTGFTTNGTPWELLANVSQDGGTAPVLIAPWKYGNRAAEGSKLKQFPQYYVDKNSIGEKFNDPTLKHGGLGTRFFGGFSNKLAPKYANPLVISKGVSKLGVYISARGKQSSMFGFVAMDEGDAPKSYGYADHLMRKLPNDPITDQPFVGTEKADMDLALPGSDFYRDDVHGSDEGELQLLGVDPLTGNSQTGIKEYNLHVASNENYELPIMANRGGRQDAYYKGWVDFNGDGKFTNDESSQLAHLTAGGRDGKITLRFNNKKQLTKSDLQRVAVRVRTSVNSDQIKNPTGFSFSGEVEDFEIKVVHPPRGLVKETTNIQGKVQTEKFIPNSGFNSYGMLKDVPQSWLDAGNVDTPQARQDFLTTTNKMYIAENKPVKIVKPDGTFVSEYDEPGIGHYAVDALGNVTFTPLKTWDGTTKAKGVVLRAYDENDQTTGWTFNESVYVDNGEELPLRNINDGDGKGYLIRGKKTMDAVYVPHVIAVVPQGSRSTTTNVQGAKQTTDINFTPGTLDVPMNKSTLAFETNEDGTPKDQPEGATLSDDGKSLTVPNEGTYKIEDDGSVSFQPLSNFVGEAKTVKFTMEDENGTKAESTYQPIVNPAEILAENQNTVHRQGKVQHATIEFKVNEDGNPTTPNTIYAPTENNPVKFVDENGNLTDDTTIDAVDKEGNKIGEYTLDPITGEVTFTPNKDFVGMPKPAKVGVYGPVDKDGNKQLAVAVYQPDVFAVKPIGTPTETADIQGATQTGTVTFTPGDTSVPMDDGVDAVFEDGTNIKIVPEEGTYTVAADGTVTFVPEPFFTGKGTGVTVVRQDTNGTRAKAKYIPTVTAVIPNADHRTTRGPQGVEQEATIEFFPGSENVPFEGGLSTKPKLVDPADNTEKNTVVIAGEGTYTIDDNGKVTFTPEKDFGKDAETTGTLLKVVRKDKNGTKAEGSYQATVVPVRPTSKDATSIDVQGKEQTGIPKFEKGNDNVPMDKSTLKFSEDGQPEGATLNSAGSSLTVPGEGVYTLDKTNGTVKFQPEGQFIGTAKSISITMKDTNGSAISATYTPTVIGVKPTATPKETSGKQGEIQRGTVEFTAGNEHVPMDGTVHATFDDGSRTKTVEGEGTYTVSKYGEVTFTPEPQFTGRANGVIVVRQDINGTKASAKYIPTVIPVTPMGEPANSEDIQGQVQTGKPIFKNGDDANTPLEASEGNPAKLVKPDGTLVDKMDAMKNGVKVGEYKIDPLTGVVTFTPNKDFVGKPDPAKVQIRDANGTPVEALYSPTVVPVTPEGRPNKSVGNQGETQSKKVEFTPGDENVPMDDTVPATFEDGSTSKTIEGEGTYTVAPNGTVTFVPEPTFIGPASGVTVVRQDTNGTKAKAKYTPFVNAIAITGVNKESSGMINQPQSETVEFKNVLSGDKFIPNADNPVKLVDNDGNLVDTLSVDGEGTYTINPETGEVTFTPEKGFVGEASSVTTRYTNKLTGKTADAKYTPTVKATTEWTTENGTVLKEKVTATEIKDEKTFSGYKFVETVDTATGKKHIYKKLIKTEWVTEDGTALKDSVLDESGQPKKVIEGYKFVRTDTDDEGNQKHIYKKLVKTEWVDTNGKKLEEPVLDENGQPKKVIEGYKFVRTDTDDEGNQKHIYKKLVKTEWVDEDGNKLEEPVTATDTKEKKDIEGYTYITSSTDKDGNLKHIYKKNDPTLETTFVDENGKELSPKVEGTQESKNIEGYKLVKTEILGTGNIKHIYKKLVKTEWVDEDGNKLEEPVTATDTKEKKDINGYKFVRTDTDETTGNVKHIYKKFVDTKWVDENGNEIKDLVSGGEFDKDHPDTITKDGVTYYKDETKQPIEEDVVKTYFYTREKVTKFVDENHNEVNVKDADKGKAFVLDNDAPAEIDFGGAKYYKSETAPTIDGNTKTIFYTKEKTTEWVDEKGKELKPLEKGKDIKDKGAVEGYTFVETVDTPTGKKHIFKKIPADKVITKWEDEEGNTLRPLVEDTVYDKDNPDTIQNIENGKVVTYYKKETVDGKGEKTYVYSKEKQTKYLINGTEVEISDTIKGKEFADKKDEIVKDGKTYLLVDANGVVDGKVKKYYYALKAAPLVPAKKVTKWVTDDKEPVELKTPEKADDYKDGDEVIKVINGDEVVKYYLTEKDPEPKKGVKTYVYTKEKVTKFVDKATGKEIEITVKDKDFAGKKEIPGYIYNGEKEVNGEKIYEYDKAKLTEWVDELGNKLQEPVTAIDTKDKRNIDGYTFVKTTTDKDGNVKHIYKKIVETTFVDGEGNPIADKEIGAKNSKPIEGYELVGTEIDKDGNVKHIYKKLVKTEWVDEKGNELETPVLDENGQPKKEIEGYKFVETTTDKDGNVKHIYKKLVKTQWVDADGKPLVEPLLDENGQPKKKIEGYKFVETTTDKDGNVKHIYKKLVKTEWVDTEGNPIQNPVTDTDTKDKKDFNGYTFVTTSTDKDGNVKHIYYKNPAPKVLVTTFVDEAGNPILPQENGAQNSKEIDGYELVNTEVDKDGNIKHIYKKLYKTEWVDEKGNELETPVVATDLKPAKAIEGYELVDTKQDEKTGNVKHIYKKLVKTEWVDEKGNPLETPTLDKKGQPSKEILGYKLVGSKTDANGDVKHTYKKLVKTQWVDTNGNELENSITDIEGQPKKVIEGYTFVTTSTDKDGNVKHIYNKVIDTKVVKTTFVDENGKVISPQEQGVKNSKEIDGYILVKTEVDKDGNVKHIYNKVKEPKKVNTTFVDEKGKPISPQEKGAKNSKEIDGYVLVKTELDKDGNVKHTYRKAKAEVNTTFVDEKGKPISPQEKGAKNSKKIKGYVLVNTEIDKDGNVKHIYKKVIAPKEINTTFVDEKGKPILPQEKGAKNSKNINGYVLVKTEIGKDGNVKHIYKKVEEPKKVTTSFVDEKGNRLDETIIDTKGQPKKSINGYEYVTTETDASGNVIHRYKKIKELTTSFVDKDTRKSVSPSVDGIVPNKVIPGYTYFTKETDGAGNVTYVYTKIEKAKEIVTTFVDENNKQIAITIVDGKGHSEKNIPGYKFIKSTFDKDGNIKHIYKKVTKEISTSFVDTKGNVLSETIVDKTVKARKNISGYRYVRTEEDKDGNVTYVYKKLVQLPKTGDGRNPVDYAKFAGIIGLIILGLGIGLKRKK